jgi:SSS family solute:Na+ symporter
MSVGLLVVTVLILYKVGWTTITEAVAVNHGAGGFNPLVHEKLGYPYLIYFALHQLAVVLTWQTTVQRFLAAKDTRTGQKIYTRTSFFFVCRFMIPGIWCMAALALLGPQWIDTPDSLYAMPKMLAMIVPAGLMGLLVAAMLAADMSTDSSYMLTWGSVIYNDILAPFRKNTSEKRGLLWNRMIVACIGIFLLFYGLWYPLKGNLWNYLSITGTIYLASMSVLLISCCYWKRANNWGAGAAIMAGAAVPIAYLVAEQLPFTADYAKQIGPYWSGIAAYVATWSAMIVGSLLKPQIETAFVEAKANHVG